MANFMNKTSCNMSNHPQIELYDSFLPYNHFINFKNGFKKIENVPKKNLIPNLLRK